MNDTLDNMISQINPWLLDHGIKILLITAGGIILYHIINKFIEKAVRIAVRRDENDTPEVEVKREDTLINIFSSTAKVAMYSMVILMVIQELGVEIGPILAGAGILGLAFGFGGQYLIRDIISGLFIILESQYRIGDVVVLDNTRGMVENISLRMTTLRDMDGTVHHLPHGEIKKVSNLAKEFGRININLGIAYSSRLDHVIQVVNRVGESMTEDAIWNELINIAPHFLRVEEFADSAIVIKIVGETKPQKQWEVAGELRKRLKEVFDKEGIEIPFPQIVVHQKN
ncbi:MAG: mechanosensitive ion channel family protein [Saprospiraceae bacterium]